MVGRRSKRRDQQQPSLLFPTGAQLPGAWVSKALLNVDDLAEIFGVSRRTVFRLRSRGAIPAPLGIGGTLLRWRTCDIQRWLDKLPTR
jgi:predicted DNA-binding transcriptional regulator AlpA